MFLLLSSFLAGGILLGQPSSSPGSEFLGFSSFCWRFCLKKLVWWVHRPSVTLYWHVPRLAARWCCSLFLREMAALACVCTLIPIKIPCLFQQTIWFSASHRWIKLESGCHIFCCRRCCCYFVAFFSPVFFFSQEVQLKFSIGQHRMLILSGWGWGFDDSWIRLDEVRPDDEPQIDQYDVHWCICSVFEAA